MLDRNAKDAANKLREKYKISPEDESDLADSLLNQKDGEKAAVDSAIRSINNRSGIDSGLASLIGQLQQRGSPEVYRLMDAILRADEGSAQPVFMSYMLFSMSPYFLDKSVPDQLRKRFLKIVIARSRNAAETDKYEVGGFFNLLSWVMPDIAAELPELAQDAYSIQILLKSKVSADSREAQERNERIRNSPDKLSAMIAEAEKTDDNEVKHDLYFNAARMALDLKKFTYSVDIIEKTTEIDMSASPIKEDIRKGIYNQFLGNVVAKALQSGEPDSADYAIKRITSSFVKAEGFRKLANYYADRHDLISAGPALDEAVRYASKEETTAITLSSLINLIPVAQKIDPGRVFDIGERAARLINAIPSLNIEDKPQTENYRKYVTSAMVINWNLLAVLTDLVKVNKMGATDLANRINKKEIKIAADFVLSIDSLSQRADQKKTAVQTKKNL